MLFEYLVLVAVAIVLVAVAPAAMQSLRHAIGSRGGEKPLLRSEVEQALRKLHRELTQSIDASQARTDDAIAIAQRIVCALGPISSALTDLKDRVTAFEALELEARHVSLKDELSGIAGEIRRIEAALSERTWESAHRQLQDMLEVLAQRVDEAESSISKLPPRLDATTERLSELNRLIDETEQLSSRLLKIETTLARPPKPEKPNGGEREPTGSSTDPGSKGGGSREPRGPSGTREPERVPKATLVATRSSGCWQLYVELQDVPNGAQSFQNSTPLSTSSTSANLFGPLMDLRTPLTIKQNENMLASVPLLSNEKPLLYFRHHGEFASQVRQPSQGLYLVIAPDDWTYDEPRSSHTPVEPESVGIPGYRVHFIAADRDWKILFHRRGSQDYFASSSAASFHLQGKQINDAEDTMGPLFAGAVPTLESKAPDHFDRISSVVVGIEGRGPSRWRKEYPFDATDQLWRDGVKENGSGWYFLRLYDSQSELIDSLDFRYSSRLREIRTAQGLNALVRDSISIEFRHDSGVTVELEDFMPDRVPHKSTTAESTFFGLPSDPRLFKARFAVREGSCGVRVSVPTDRIWWRIVRAGENSPWWDATELEVRKDDFLGVSEATLELYLPRIERVRIGFSRDDSRAVPIGANSEARLALNSFSGSEPLEQQGGKDLMLWADTEESQVELRLARLSVPARCKWCEFTAVDAQQLAQHATSEHHLRCFEQLALRGEGGSRALFVCSCGQYYPDSALPDENPIDRLSRHVDRDHLNKTLSYTKISDPEHIQILTGMKDKWVWRCKIGHNCRPIAPTGSDQQSSPDKIDHLWQEHSNDLCIDSDTRIVHDEARRIVS